MKVVALLALASAAAAAPLRTVIVTQTQWVTVKGSKPDATAPAAPATIAGESIGTVASVATNAAVSSSGGNGFPFNLNNLFGGNSATADTTADTTTITGTTATAGTTTAAVSDLFQVSSIGDVQFGVGSPTTSSTAAAAASSSTAASSSASSSGGSGTNSGQGTFYDTGLGACGWQSTDSDYIVAIDIKTYNAHNVDANPNHNSLCGKKIRAFYGGKSVDVKVVDACEGCKVNDLDFSPSAFQQLADEGLGRIDITWEWL